MNHFDVDSNKCVRVQVITDPQYAVATRESHLSGGGGLGHPLGIHMLPNALRAGSC